MSDKTCRDYVDEPNPTLHWGCVMVSIRLMQHRCPCFSTAHVYTCLRMLRGLNAAQHACLGKDLQLRLRLVEYTRARCT